MTTTDAIAARDLFVGLEDDWESAARYLSIFIDEAEHTIDELIAALLALEAGGGRESIEQLFIAAHRMKGSAASIGLNRVAKISHLMEDVLQMLVDSGKTLTPEMADAMLNCTDGLRQYVDVMKSGRPEKDRFDVLAEQLVLARGLMGDEKEEQPAEAASQAAESMKAAEEAVRAAVESTQAGPAISTTLYDKVAAQVREDQRDSTLLGVVTFDPSMPQVTMKARLFYDKLSNLGDIRYFDPTPAELDNLNEVEAVSFGVVTENSPDAIRRMLRIAGIVKLEIEPLAAQAAPLPAATAVPSQAAPTTVADEKTPAAQAAETPQAERQQGKAKSLEATVKPPETLRVDIERLDRLMNLAGQLAISKARVAQIAERLNKVVSHGASARAIGNVVLELEKLAEGATTSNTVAALRADMEHIRYTANHLHKELETVHSEVEALTQARSHVNDLFETIHLLDRVSDGIHQSVMDTRMLPIGPLFARFHRVIRDMTRTNGKDIRLEINGEKTELDKRMIDELADPMIHMIRNSADHGIESPEARAAAGKPRQGVVSLDAFHRGSNIMIRVSDDGRGMDYERILAKALEKGLVSPADAEKMTQQQILQLIWLPNFSTAEKLTEVSGRGVGMDIVRSKIEELNGTIEVESEKGKGTAISIKLPLTLAILPSLMVEINKDVFAFPLESVQEIVHVRRGDLRTVSGKAAASVRDRIVAVVTLDAVFDWRNGSKLNTEGDGITLVIIGEGDRQLGLAVDRVVGEEDVVIKSIADNYRNVAGIAGASILGDGRVSLILDPPTLIEMSSRPVGATANS